MSTADIRKSPSIAALLKADAANLVPVSVSHLFF
jgi:hypothetical protein